MQSPNGINNESFFPQKYFHNKRPVQWAPDHPPSPYIIELFEGSKPDNEGLSNWSWCLCKFLPTRFITKESVFKLICSFPLYLIFQGIQVFLERYYVNYVFRLSESGTEYSTLLKYHFVSVGGRNTYIILKIM